MRNIVIVSADHHGDCLLGMSFDDDSKVLSIRHLHENIVSRAGIVDRIKPMLDELFPPKLSSRFDAFYAIDNEVLAAYIGRNLTFRGEARRPIKQPLPSNPKESIYRLKCAIDEGNLEAGEWADTIDVALAAENNPERIEGHLVLCLAVAIDKFYDSSRRPFSINRGMVIR